MNPALIGDTPTVAAKTSVPASLRRRESRWGDPVFRGVAVAAGAIMPGISTSISTIFSKVGSVMAAAAAS